MRSEEKLQDLVEKQVPGLFIILVAFGMIELGILMACVAYSADQDMIRIYNPAKEIIYENRYNPNQISEFKKIYGIENFQEQGFVVQRVEKDVPFPTRAWIALSICIPMCFALFVAFIVKIFKDMFHSEKPEGKKDRPGEENQEFEETKFEKLFSTLGRLNIYSLGATVILAAFFFWMVPDLLVFIGRISFQTLLEFKWVFLGIIALGGFYLILKTYLSYKTKTEIIRQQSLIQQNRDRLAIEAKVGTKLLEDKDESSV